jgi:hypothetical protein
MSWKTIFESARRMNAPVIVTDDQGREPLVVLPLAAYEASRSHQHVDTSPVRQSGSAKVSSHEGVRFEAMAEAATESFQRDVQAALADFELPNDEKTPDISLEERFYLEPLDDGQETK